MPDILSAGMLAEALGISNTSALNSAGFAEPDGEAEAGTERLA